MLNCCRHVQPGLLKCYIYHGQKRKDVSILGEYDIVIASYYTVSEIWRQKEGITYEEPSIFTICWHRIVLDEGKDIPETGPQS